MVTGDQCIILVSGNTRELDCHSGCAARVGAAIRFASTYAFVNPGKNTVSSLVTSGATAE